MELYILKGIELYIAFIENKNIDAILLPEVPHAFGDYIIKLVANHYGTKILCFKNAVAGRKLTRLHDLHANKDIIAETLQKDNGEFEMIQLEEVYENAKNLGKLPYSNSHAEFIKNDFRGAHAELKKAMTGSVIGKISSILNFYNLKKFKKRLDPRLYNGAIFLGLDSPVVKSHGGTDFIGFSNSLDVCNKIVKGNLIEKIKYNI